MNFYLSYKKNHEFIYTFTTYQTVSRSMQMAFNSNYAQKKYTAEQFLLCFIRLTWSLPPHSPAGRFAHKPCSPLLLLSTLSAGLTSKPHHAHNFFIAYVDRFACDWPRLSTTDPLCTFIISIKRTFVTHCPS